MTKTFSCVSLLILLAGFGCTSLPPSVHTVSQITNDGRMLSAGTDSDRNKSTMQVTAGDEEQPPSVRIGDTEVSIQGDELAVDGQIVAKIPIDAKHIEVRDTVGTKHVLADGITIYEVK
ncbi:MAG: hypothetical protein KDA86_01325 [Planctomycetaceae bacterium]|nr:hypothetical protein [Planctomycetaceae bacterium]